MVVKLMTQDTKDRIRELEGQKVILEDRLEHLGYSGNLVRMHEIAVLSSSYAGKERMIVLDI